MYLNFPMIDYELDSYNVLEMLSKFNELDMHIK